MAFRILKKFPLVSDYHKDKSITEAQNAYFATVDSNSTYLEPEPTVLGWLKDQVPTKQGAIEYIVDTFPCSKWICNYNLQWLMGDVVSGITVGAVVIPQGMAYAKLAQLPVQYGLYTSFIGGLAYWIFGTSKDITIGPVAVASIVTASIVAELEAEHPKMTLAAPALAGIVAMLAGAVVALIGILRLGWLVNLISLAAVSSFITGSAITITFGQIPALLGMRHINSRDPGILIGVSILKHLDRVRIDAAFGISSLVLLYAIKWTCTFMAKKKPQMAKSIFFASTLRTVFVILLYTIISFGLNHNRKENPVIRILGFIPRGFQHMEMPKVDSELMSAMISTIPAASIVLVIEHISIGKEFGRINNYTINPNSEFIAIGVCNVVGPFLGAYAATGSLSRTAINSKAGARTPMSGVVTALVVVVAMYTMTAGFFFVPTSVLAAVIIHAIGDLVTPPSTLYRFWKISPLDVIFFIIGTTINLTSSIEHGIFAMIILSLVLLLFRKIQAHGSFLGLLKIRTNKSSSSAASSPTDSAASSVKWSDKNTPDSRIIFLPLNRKDGSNPALALEIPSPGTFIFRLTEGFSYASCGTQLEELITVLTAATQRGEPLVFDRPGDRPWNVPRVTHVADSPLDVRPLLKAVILDFSAVDNVDLTSIQYLIDVRNQLARHAAPHAVQWHFACVWNPWTKRALAAAGFGYPSFETDDGRPVKFKPVYSFAAVDGEGNAGREVGKHMEGVKEVDVESGKVVVEKLEVLGDGQVSDEQMEGVAAVHGINRPFFHPDIQGALNSVAANDVFLDDTPAEKLIDEDEMAEAIDVKEKES